MSRIKRYTVVNNIPGYLPEDVEPYHGLILEDAMSALREDVERYVGDYSEEGYVYRETWSDDGTFCRVVTGEQRDFQTERVFTLIEEDDDAEYYTVEGWNGIGWNVVGYVTTQDEDYEWTGIEDEDRSRVVAIMVGDDRRFEHDIADVTPHYDEPLCGCGQIGCGWHGEEGSALPALVVGVVLVLVLAVLAIYAIGQAAEHEAKCSTLSGQCSTP